MKILTLTLAAALVAAAAPAAANSFTNGGFESLTNGPGQIGFNTDATGWTIGNYPYTFVFAPGTADSTGSNGIFGNLSLWGPNNGSANGLTASSPNGGNFIAMDGNFPGEPTGPLSQTISGLTVGKTYTVGFKYGFAQQFGFDGETIQNWTVNFAGQSATTADFTVPNHGFTGWMSTSYDFIANNATETLSFVAFGNVPVPPFALLDGVTFTQEVPEPSTWMMLIAGFGLVGFAARRRRDTVSVTA
ncbi:MAG: PEPxxWA-CTERM sorting domain-containing protein [Polymorphobacter sp.]